MNDIQSFYFFYRLCPDFYCLLCHLLSGRITFGVHLQETTNPGKVLPLLNLLQVHACYAARIIPDQILS